MRAKKMQLVITFPSTIMAMKMEKEMQEINAPGRIIPVPKAITASCGLAYITEPEQEHQMVEWMHERQIDYDKMTNLML